MKKVSNEIITAFIIVAFWSSVVSATYAQDLDPKKELNMSKQANPTARFKLSGKVRDILAGAIQEARVTIRNSKTGESFSTSTDNEGKFQFTDIPKGNYLLTVVAANFFTRRIQNLPIKKNVVLRPLTLDVGTSAKVIV